MKTIKINFTNILLMFLFSTSTNLQAQVASLEATMSLKQVDGIRIPFQNGFAVPTFEKQDRQIIDLKGEWKKQRFAADDNITLKKRDATGYQSLITEAAGRESASYDDSGWPVKNLPAVENTMNQYPAVPEFYEDGVWYRKNFTVDSAVNGKFIKLMFYAVNYVADVWLNDVYLGYHEGGYTPFAFDVSSALNYGGNNVIVVRVDNPVWGSRDDIVPYTRCDWFNYTGIIHDVYLEVSEPVSVIRTNIVPQNINGDIQTTVVLYNTSGSDQSVDVTVEVFSADINTGNINSEFTSNLIGTSASLSGVNQNSFTIKDDSAKVWRTDLTVNNPNLWSPKNPNLYVMKVTIKQGSNTIDEYYTQFGIRTVHTDVDKVYLNNNPVFFTGVARHEDHPIFGRSMPIDSIYSDMLKVKDINANMLRTAHYPNHLYTYQLADRLGITIVEEIPVWWFDTALAWIIQNNERHIHEQMFREMVFKDYNRPSIFMWSTANECLDVPNRKIFIDRVNQDLDQNYPDGRLVTQSAAADRPGSNDDSQLACDVMGWTMYFGVFHGSTYFTGTFNFLNNVKINLPGKPILDTEFGYWSSEDGTSTQKQKDVFDFTFLAFKSHAALNTNGTINPSGALMGITWWCIFDWYSHQHPGGYQSMGLYGMDRVTAKPVASNLKTGYLPYYNFGGAATDVDLETGFIPTEFLLEQNFPNPFNPETEIKFDIKNSGFVSLKIYDILGNLVQELVNKEMNAGSYKVNFDAANLASGVYIYKLQSGSFINSKKMVLLK